MRKARNEAALSESFGALLYRLRSERNLSQRAAAGLIGISQSRLVGLEHGRDPHTGRPTLPSPDVVARIAAAYHYPKERLMLLAGYLPWCIDESEAAHLITFGMQSYQDQELMLKHFGLDTPG